MSGVAASMPVAAADAAAVDSSYSVMCLYAEHTYEIVADSLVASGSHLAAAQSHESAFARVVAEKAHAYLVVVDAVAKVVVAAVGADHDACLVGCNDLWQLFDLAAVEPVAVFVIACDY